jgi:hypothetical protein
MTIHAHGIQSDTGHLPVNREAHTTAPVTTTWLPWSEHPITFDESDQPKHSVNVGKFPLVISTILKTVAPPKSTWTEEAIPIQYIRTLSKD